MQAFPLNTCQLLKIALELIKQQSTVLLFRHHYQGGRGQQQGSSQRHHSNVSYAQELVTELRRVSHPLSCP